MPQEEEKIFTNKVKETILPIAIYMNKDEDKKIIENIGSSNKNLSNSFGKILYEQITILKYNRLSQK